VKILTENLFFQSFLIFRQPDVNYFWATFSNTELESLRLKMEAHMRSDFAIRPYLTSLLAVCTGRDAFAKLVLAFFMAVGAMHLPTSAAQAADQHPASVEQALRNQLQYAVTDDRALLQAWYGARKFEPIWVTSTGLNADGKAAIAALSQVGNEGLPPARYDLSALTHANSGQSTTTQAELEVAITIAVQTYLHDLRHGAANPHAPAFGVEDLALIEKSGFAKAVASARPSNPRYGALSQKLAEDRNAKANKGQVQETILALEQLRWEQEQAAKGKEVASLHNLLQ
jgi:murein L,D-transpeptidase YcbB/YkuD